MRKVKIGVIGIGTMGELHVNVFSDLTNSEVKAVVDFDIEKAKNVCTKMGIDVSIYKDYNDMLKDSNIDAVAIAVPDSMHKDPVIASLQAGKHVIVEKPLATKLDDCDEMIRSSEKYGKILMVNYSHRWAASYYKAKEIIDSGEIGSLAMAYARKNDTIGIINMWKWLIDSTPVAFLSSHDIDLIRWYMGCEAKSVYAKAYAKVLKGKGYNTIDAVQALVEFTNGAIATFESGWIYPDTFPTLTDSYIELVGEHGVIHLDRKRESFEYAIPEKYSYPKLSISYKVNGKIHGAFRLSLEHFIDCIIKGIQPLTSGYEARNVAEIVEGIHRSIEQGEIITFPLK